MGFWDTVNDIVEAAVPWATAEAEAPPAEEKVRSEPPLPSSIASRRQTPAI